LGLPAVPPRELLLPDAAFFAFLGVQFVEVPAVIRGVEDLG
jgi:hypothetical protein